MKLNDGQIIKEYGGFVQRYALSKDDETKKCQFVGDQVNLTIYRYPFLKNISETFSKNDSLGCALTI
jgi:hypothetical protein